MKKLATSLLTIFALCGGVTAQEVSVPNVEALQGEEVSLTLQLDVNGGSYTALEFDIQFPKDGFTTGSGHTATGWDGVFTIGDVGGVSIDNLARCGAMSNNDTPIPDEDLRTLGTVNFTVPAGIALGNHTVTLTNMTLVGATRVPVADATFTLSVVEAHVVVLDELSTIAPEAATGVNVKVKRSIKANSWSTICLPFAMTAEQVTSTFGAGVLVKDFMGCETTKSGDDVTALKLNFSTVTAMEANHPYLIKVANAITYEDGFTVEGVDITPEAEPIVNRDQKSVKIYGQTFYFYNSFVGTYTKDTQVPNLSLFISNDKFYYSNGSTMMKAFRGYFNLYDRLTSVDNASGRISMVDDETTGINTIHGANGNADGYYDLQGRKIENPKKGLYIVNGKKTVVK